MTQPKQTHKLTVKDLVDILKDYSIEHVTFFTGDNDTQYLGMADDTKKMISINQNRTSHERRTAVIHELYHTLHFMKGDLDGLSIREVEKIVEVESKEHYDEMYKRK